MLRGVLCFPVFFWLLMPPGICLCHLPETILATLLPEQFAPPAPHDHETDHPPGCTYRKMPLVEEEALDLSHFAGVVLELLLPLIEICPSDPLPSAALVSPLDCGQQPLYLARLALRL